jgi:DNA-binding transcriptional regulator YiaG
MTRKKKRSLASVTFTKLFRAKWPSRRIAAELGCSKTTVQAWLAGTVDPLPETAAALWALLGVANPPATWGKRARALFAQVTAPRFTRRGFARLIKRSERSIANYAQGRQVPSTPIAVLIQQIAPEVRVPDWFERP